MAQTFIITKIPEGSDAKLLKSTINEKIESIDWVFIIPVGQTQTMIIQTLESKSVDSVRAILVESLKDDTFEIETRAIKLISSSTPTCLLYNIPQIIGNDRSSVVQFISCFDSVLLPNKDEGVPIYLIEYKNTAANRFVQSILPNLDFAGSKISIADSSRNVPIIKILGTPTGLTQELLEQQFGDVHMKLNNRSILFDTVTDRNAFLAKNAVFQYHVGDNIHCVHLVPFIISSEFKEMDQLSNTVLYNGASLEVPAAYTLFRQYGSIYSIYKSDEGKQYKVTYFDVKATDECAKRKDVKYSLPPILACYNVPSTFSHQDLISLLKGFNIVSCSVTSRGRHALQTAKIEFKTYADLVAARTERAEQLASHKLRFTLLLYTDPANTEERYRKTRDALLSTVHVLVTFPPNAPITEAALANRYSLAGVIRLLDLNTAAGTAAIKFAEDVNILDVVNYFEETYVSGVQVKTTMKNSRQQRINSLQDMDLSRHNSRP